MKIEDKIGLGTVQFGLSYGISNTSGQTPSSEVEHILNFAKKSGITLLDSAAAYGNAEEVLGNKETTGFKLVSKFRPAVEGRTVEDQLKKSLTDLKRPSIYAYLAHSPQALLESPEEWDRLKMLKEQGKTTKIGYSLNAPWELEELLELEYIPDLVQLPYNYFDRRFESKLGKLKNLGCEVHSRSAFFQGLFFVDPEGLDAFFDPIKPDLSALQKHPSFSAGSLLKFVIGNEQIDKVIIGVETVQQLKDTLNDIKTAEDLPQMTKAIDPTILIPSNWPKK
jgi:aryl-alcohol dehydrogenase-like predicted oxidoreductase